MSARTSPIKPTRSALSSSPNAKKLEMFFFLSSMLTFSSKKSCSKNNHSSFPKHQNHPLLDKLSAKTLVWDVEGALLRSSATFTYFMLVALEAGGFLRALLLLLVYPLVCCVSHEMGLRVMVMVSFCGLRKEGFRVGRAVLPKFFLEDVGLEAFEVLRRGGRRVSVSRMPRVMVEGFLKEYLEVDVVVGRELKVLGGYYSGFMEPDSDLNEVLASQGFFGEEEQAGDGFIVVCSSSTKSLQHPFLHCKETYMVSEADKRNWHPLPRDKYPQPLIFHDGRVAFRPTQSNMTAMFMWLPFGFSLAILRFFIVILLPFKLSTPILAFTGMTWTLRGKPPSTPHPTPPPNKRSTENGCLYVCNHRTLIDPIYVSVALDKQVTAVTYSLSRISELISCIKTIRLTRNREEDRRTMVSVLRQGNLVVCPEGTTCREPYLLRFSPLFAEITNEIIPVALDVNVSMFHATTAGGLKCWDPLYYLLNPSVSYELQFLQKIDTRSVRVGECSSIDMANHVQRVIGEALGFQCTMLTRKNKYRMLVGSDGNVAPPEPEKEVPHK